MRRLLLLGGGADMKNKVCLMVSICDTFFMLPSLDQV